MSKEKAKENRFYFGPPHTERIEGILADIKRLRVINRKPMRLKLDPYIATVIACIDLNMSLRDISKVLLIEHKVKSKKDAIRNFIHRYDLKGQVASNKD
jgi:hypothetical protein